MDGRPLDLAGKPALIAVYSITVSVKCIPFPTAHFLETVMMNFNPLKVYLYVEFRRWTHTYIFHIFTNY